MKSHWFSLLFLSESPFRPLFPLLVFRFLNFFLRSFSIWSVLVLLPHHFCVPLSFDVVVFLSFHFFIRWILVLSPWFFKFSKQISPKEWVLIFLEWSFHMLFFSKKLWLVNWKEDSVSLINLLSSRSIIENEYFQNFPCLCGFFSLSNTKYSPTCLPCANENRGGLFCCTSSLPPPFLAFFSAWNFLSFLRSILEDAIIKHF